MTPLTFHALNVIIIIAGYVILNIPVVQDVHTRPSRCVTLVAHVPIERRSRSLHQLNEDLEGLAKIETVFVDAAPNLFGEKFPQKSKQYSDQVKEASQRDGIFKKAAS